MQTSSRLSQAVQDIKSVNPIHGKKLGKSLSDMDERYFHKAEQFLSKYEHYASSQGKDMQYGIASYLTMLDGMLGEYVHFMRTDEYRCKSSADAYESVYSDPAVMEPYMHGLLFSQILWKHHYKIYEFFTRSITEYRGQVDNYLEIGGGHGLYLSEAIKTLGSDTRYTMVDISESSLQMAKTFVTDGDVDFVLSDINDYAPREKFDFISMGEVLEHVDDPKALLETLAGLLSDDGTLFVTTPTNAPAIDHIYLFRNEAEIDQLITDSGFRIKDKIGVFSEDVDKEVGEKNKIAMLYGAFLEHA